jgi:hypothetical protein
MEAGVRGKKVNRDERKKGFLLTHVTHEEVSTGMGRVV